MPQCAFCDHTGKLSSEHIVSEWLSKLFPGPIRAKYGEGGIVIKEFTTNAMDYKAKVVCEQCNNTWMSDIEEQHAKPVLTPLVTGQRGILIDKTSAESLALFAFKTAIVLDQANRNDTPFFHRHLRHAFRRSHWIPPFVQMWMCGYAGHRATGRVMTVYHKGKTPSGSGFQMYVCTCAFGYFVFQVLAVKQIGNAGFRSLTPFKEDFAIPFWPSIPKNFVWPHSLVLKTSEEFEAFVSRWKNLSIIDR